MSRTVQLPRAAVRGLALTLLLAATLLGTAMGGGGGRSGPAVKAGAFESAITPGSGIGWDTAPANETV